MKRVAARGARTRFRFWPVRHTHQRMARHGALFSSGRWRSWLRCAKWVRLTSSSPSTRRPWGLAVKSPAHLFGPSPATS